MGNRLTGPKACSLKRLEVSLLPSRKDLVKEKLHVFPGPFVRIPVGIVNLTCYKRKGTDSPSDATIPHAHTASFQT
jgi:hypothetical protein